MMKDNYEYKWFIQRVGAEQEVGRPLTDEEWTEFLAEFEGRMDNFGNELFDELVKDVQVGKIIYRPSKEEM